MNDLQKIPGQTALSSVLQSPVGGWLVRQWLDPKILSTLKSWYFPLSRLWAAASVSRGEMALFERFAGLSEGGRRVRFGQGKLERFEQLKAASAQATSHWHEMFFHPNAQSLSQLQSAEKARVNARHEFYVSRRLFRPLASHLNALVQTDFSAPQLMEQRYNLPDRVLLRGFMPASQMPEVQQSHSIPASTGREHWLRFRSPSQSMGDWVYARVSEPVHVKNPPTLIFAHGFGIESDHWRFSIDPFALLTALGVRVIRPEAPWHGYRAPEGQYGGEKFLASLPGGAFDYFSAQHQEWSVLTHWCRQQGDAPVAFGGCSLGAFVVQAIAAHARYWPAPLQPDALLLMNHSQYLWEPVLRGQLSEVLSQRRSLNKAGWDYESLQYWISRLDAEENPCVSGENIVSVLGKFDKMAPYHSGVELQDRWQVPESNRFHWPCGHFSLPMRLMHDQAPLLALNRVLQGLQRDAGQANAPVQSRIA